ncbi:MAG: (p)ppGpp synthetase [Cycloclasticus sp. symbiont of Poecilosclerida sp. M]|nr:MAG: (p)ppGpp synthetase [Cycloclasticus sp. symbiont of Poecilosclerida sp. M]
MTASNRTQEKLPQDELIDDLSKAISEYLDKDQVKQVVDAYHYAGKAHAGQFRLSGEDYICHPVSVAIILSKMKMDADCIMAAILHDVLEDTDSTFEDLAQHFNGSVASLVEAVSKLTKIDFKTREHAQAESMRKMFLAMTKDLRVIIIKLADRLHNMRTIGVMKPASQRRIARETLELYAPIANRLGMHDFRLELEDLSFKARFPRRREIIEKRIKSERGNRKEVLDKIEQELKVCSEKAGFSCEIKGREKNLYSIYRKMYRQRISFSEVFDVYAFRIIVGTVAQCYQALGLLHNLYRPVPGKFKDYIALPKSNGYQSLHTVLLAPFGVPVEMQIRTIEMDGVAESGIAAHWLYKTDGISHTMKAQADEWLRNLLETQKNKDDGYEFVDDLKVDLFPQELYVFTPKGRIVKLPQGATTVDFAFSVHTDVGMTCAGAKVNRRMEPLHTALRNGQTVEIITSDFAVCNPSWLNFVVTNKARNAIRNYLKELKEGDAISLGGQLLNAELKELRTNHKKLPADEIKKFLDEQQLASMDALLIDIGFGNRLPILVAQQLTSPGDEEEMASGLSKKNVSRTALKVHGADGMLTDLASCCRPVPGDKIVGLFSPGRGVVVHRLHCKNIRGNKHKHKGWVNVEWGDSIEGEFSCDLQLELIDERGVLAQIASMLSSYGCNIENINMRSNVEGSPTDIFTITVRNRKHLARVMRRLRTLPSIQKITRVRN